MKKQANGNGKKKIKLIDDEFRDKNFDEKGKFIKGNVIGRMPKTGYNLSDLNRMILEYEKSKQNKKGPLLKHFIKRLFKNDKLLAKYMDKNIATRSINELTGADGGPLNITLNELIYGKEPEKSNKENSGEPETPDK